MPDSVAKKGKVVRVTGENLLHCINLFEESAVLDFEAVFSTYCVNPIQTDKGIIYANEYSYKIILYNDKPLN